MTQRFVSGFDVGAEVTPMLSVSNVVVPEHLKYKVSFLSDILNFIFGLRYENNVIVAKGMTISSIITIFGVKGVGKTTFALQVLSEYEKLEKKCGLISNEEPVEQLKLACERLKIYNIDVAHKKTLEDLLEQIEEYDLLVIDSLQGVVMQNEKKDVEKRVMNALTAHAKMHSCSLIIITHATKSGIAKGNSSVGHIADETIAIYPGNQTFKNDFFLENSPIIINVEKNRFGQTGMAIVERSNNGYDFEDSPNLSCDCLLPFEPRYIQK